jgi:hypothetical protein
MTTRDDPPTLLKGPPMTTVSRHSDTLFHDLLAPEEVNYVRSRARASSPMRL